MATEACIQVERLTTLKVGLQERQSPLAYWATVYEAANLSLQAAIAAQRFQRPDLVIRMANAYIAHFEETLATEDERSLPGAWRLAMAASHTRRYTMLQHLFLSMNARANFDLAICLGERFHAEELAAFKRDFFHVNTVLQDLYARVADWIAAVYDLKAQGEHWLLHSMRYPIIGIGVAFAPDPVRGMRQLWMQFQQWTGHATREKAWSTAEQWVGSDHQGRQALMQRLDSTSENIATYIYRPHRAIASLLDWQHRQEPRSIHAICNLF